MKKYIIGIDEVGRGALAGRVVVAAVLIPADLNVEKINFLNLPFRDSKKLSPRQREWWVKQLRLGGKIIWATAGISAGRIDKINISRAANMAATNAFLKLVRKADFTGTSVSRCRVFLDGGLYLDNSKIKDFDFAAETVIRGDENIPAVKLASIIAKVIRDQQMVRLNKKYPRYDFHIHKGYGTARHFRTIARYGVCPEHRLTFLEKALK